MRTTTEQAATSLHQILNETLSESSDVLDVDAIMDLLSTAGVMGQINDLLLAINSGRDVEVIASDELLTTTETARRLSVSRRILRRMIDDSELRAMKLPGSTHLRIPAFEVARILRERDQSFWAPVTEKDLPSAAAIAAALASSAESASAA